MKPQVLFVVADFSPGGAERNLVALLHRLQEQRDAIDLTVLLLQREGALLADLPATTRLLVACAPSPYAALFKRPLWRPAPPGAPRGTALRQVAALLAALAVGRPRAERWLAPRRLPTDGTTFDAVVAYGEWLPFADLLPHIRSRRRAIWVHTDIDRLPFYVSESCRRAYLDADAIFVPSAATGTAMRRVFPGAVWPLVLANLFDPRELLARASEPAALPDSDGEPVVVTVANIRPEKRLLEAVAVHRRLDAAGVRFRWWVIGHPVNPELATRLEKAVAGSGLADRHLLLGGRENPLPWLRRADVVAVLSAFESWNRVLTESAVLGRARLATPTSGARAQITDGVNGLLAPFDEAGAAETLAGLLRDPRLRERLGEAAARDAIPPDPLPGLLRWMQGEEPPRRCRVAFVVDHPNYAGGAHVALWNLLGRLTLDERFAFSVLTGEPALASLQERFPSVAFADLATGRAGEAPAQPFWQVMLTAPWKARFRRLSSVAAAPVRRLARLAGHTNVTAESRALEALCEGVDVVVVASEGSRFRDAVSRLPVSRKVQWIHTDYARWREFSDYTRGLTRHDAGTYGCFDRFVAVSQPTGNGFAACHPHLAPRLAVIRNFIDVEEIRRLSREPLDQPLPEGLHVVTVARLAPEKALDRAIRVHRMLLDRGIACSWTVVGDGPLRAELEEQAAAAGLTGRFRLTGHLDNPFPWVATATCFALVSHYEGTPNTVVEAQALGVPVLATRVGGLAACLEDGLTGRLVGEDDAAIAEALAQMLLDVPWRTRARDYLLAHTPSFESEAQRFAQLLADLGEPGKTPT